MLFYQKINHWFEHHGRKNLPWQQISNDETQQRYSIWISEIMLQQTQVQTVIPYFQKWMSRFPTLADVALAPLEEVMLYWQGLGYYARVRNIHATTQYLQTHPLYGGQFPSVLSEVEKLKGIGPSTARAILAASIGQVLPILDGNVKRVVSRFTGIGLHAIVNAHWEKLMWQKVEELIEPINSISNTTNQQKAVKQYTQAMMDLGATVCTYLNPSCEKCPISSDCVAFSKSLVEQLPPKKKAIKIQEEQLHFLWVTKKIDSQTFILLKQRPKSGIWGGLFEPLSIENTEVSFIDTALTAPFLSQQHRLTHKKLNLNHYLNSNLNLNLNAELKNFQWYDMSNLPAIPQPFLQVTALLLNLNKTT